jgi:hypothetical protein
VSEIRTQEVPSEREHPKGEYPRSGFKVSPTLGQGLRGLRRVRRITLGRGSWTLAAPIVAPIVGSELSSWEFVDAYVVDNHVHGERAVVNGTAHVAANSYTEDDVFADAVERGGRSEGAI